MRRNIQSLKNTLGWMLPAVLISFTFPAILTSCSSSESSHQDPYLKAIDQESKHSKDYDGFHNTFDARATLMTSGIKMKQIERDSKLYLWTVEKKDEEVSKSQKDLSQYSKLFLSFYTPVKKFNNLDKKNSLWRVFLDSEGKRYVGKVKKLRNKNGEVSKHYPLHNRWSLAYMVTFKVPMTVAEKTDSKVIVTGPVGKAVFEFEKQK